MKHILKFIFCLVFLPSISLADELPELAEIATKHYKGKKSITTAADEHEDSIRIDFSNQIERLQVNEIDNPVMRAKYRLEEFGVKFLAVKKYTAEVFIYAGDETLNCYITFEKNKVHSIHNCGEKY